jgi:uncharacterized protein YndB with AHSA1/START domain
MSGTSVKVIPAVLVERTFSVDRECVFNAWTDTNELKNWFFPENGYTVPFAEINLRKNTRYRIAIKDKGGNTQLFGGIINQLVVPEKLCYTWAVNGGGTQQIKTLVSIDFIEKGGQTEVKLIHENFTDEKTRENYEKQWNYMFDQLAKYL